MYMELKVDVFVHAWQQLMDRNTGPHKILS